MYGIMCKLLNACTLTLMAHAPHQWPAEKHRSATHSALHQAWRTLRLQETSQPAASRRNLVGARRHRASEESAGTKGHPSGEHLFLTGAWSEALPAVQLYIALARRVGHRISGPVPGKHPECARIVGKSSKCHLGAVDCCNLKAHHQAHDTKMAASHAALFWQMPDHFDLSHDHPSDFDLLTRAVQEGSSAQPLYRPFQV